MFKGVAECFCDKYVQLTRIACGGWRRPHSFVVGNVPEHQFCFAYLKVCPMFITLFINVSCRFHYKKVY